MIGGFRERELTREVGTVRISGDNCELGLRAGNLGSLAALHGQFLQEGVAVGQLVGAIAHIPGQLSFRVGTVRSACD